MATEGTGASPARSLGQGWKVSPSIDVTPGATAVLAGHEHLYERIVRNDFPYFINGLGGAARYNFRSPPLAGSEARYNANWGAMYVEATSYYLYFAFIAVDGTWADSYVVWA